MFWFKSRKEEQKDLPQYQRDFDLSPQGDHYMFWEYLEVGKFFSHIYWFCFWRHSEDKVIVFVYSFFIFFFFCFGEKFSMTDDK